LRIYLFVYLQYISIYEYIVSILYDIYVPAQPRTIPVGQLAGPTTNLPRSGVDRIVE
jgi:hypothetical protein